ncbi:hypothetical protein [Paraburkholderia sp. BCC1886]|uniref:hypothetical protein n=1 Tax=Paraburkholderia sp. BCC1886 TaxID=2562670 RepID=UPI0011842432|nr:hypothetical protein [Paraburkholderia sp. BCC1886]
MELGNELFGHSRGQHEVDRDTYTPLFTALLDVMGQDSYGEKFDNAVFSIRPYCWCDKPLCPQCGLGTEKNFVFRPIAFELSWYKYPLRDAYTNIPLTQAILRNVIGMSIESLATVREGESKEAWISAVKTMHNDRLKEFMKSRAKHNPSEVVSNLVGAREKFERNATAGAHGNTLRSALVDADGKPMAFKSSQTPPKSAGGPAGRPSTTKRLVLAPKLEQATPQPTTLRDLISGAVEQRGVSRAAAFGRQKSGDKKK